MKNKIITFLFMGYIFLFLILHIFIKDFDVSFSERRTLKEFPNFEISNNYIENLDKYFLDHFPFRDKFKNIKANFNYKILKKLDNNNIYIKDNYIYKMEYPTNKDSIINFINKTRNLKELLKEDNNVYLMIIPDKNYYLNDDNFLQLDYDYIYNELKKLNIETIDLRTILNQNDYYYTDTHWKQENLEKVVEEMNNLMDFNYEKENYVKNTYDNFYGVYHGQSGIERKPETLTYLTNDLINNSYVYYLENKKLHNIYNYSKLNSFDSYEIFLDGATSFIEIYNYNCKEEKELIVFRDSFGSSLIPLLIPYYSKITVIDNRYINSDIFSELVSFNNQDVIFMYSTLIVNNSYSLKG